MHREEEYSENHQSRLIAATGCLSNPVEVEVTKLHDFLYEPENQRPPAVISDEKKPGFWKSIFGEKRCKACSQRKGECTCKCKKNNAGRLNRPGHGTSRAIQKHENCSTTCPLPMNQGTGCHLYFCIDSKRKKQPVKSKTNKNKHNEKIKTNVKPFPQLGSNETYHEGVPNITIFCDDSKDGLENPNIQTRSYLTTKTNGKPFFKDMSFSTDSNATRKFNKYLTGEKAVFQFQNSDINLLDVNTIDKPKLKNIETSTENCFFANQNNEGQTAHFGPVVKEDIVFLQKTVPANKQQNKYGTIDTNKLDEKQTLSEEMNKGIGVLRNFTGELNKTENIVSAVKIDLAKSYENLSSTDKKQKFHPDNELDDESLLNKEYNIPKYRKKTRKSTAKSGLFVRNSLITLRRERRNSDLEGRVSLILEKLGSIENKITELEKMNTKEKENNITMGITCEGKQSKVSIKFDNRSSKEVSANQPNLVGVSQSGVKSNKTIRITSHNENIYLKTPGEVKIVRSKQQEGDPGNRSKQLIYENAYKMDAHTIGSNSTTIQCKNPKVVLSYQKPEPICKNPHCTGKWRRISEELK